MLMRKEVANLEVDKPVDRLITPVSRESALPLSFAQQRLWFIDQLEPGRAQYNFPLTLRVMGERRCELLESVLSEVSRRHEVLRTRFEVRDDQPVQVIDEAGPVEASVIDVSGLGEWQREEEAGKIAAEEAARSFDLGRGPLLRAGILRLARQAQVLMITMHHVVSDGWSVDVLTNEVNKLYAAYSRGESSTLEELAIQYADYAVWQRGWLRRRNARASDRLLERATGGAGGARGADGPSQTCDSELGRRGRGHADS